MVDIIPHDPFLLEYKTTCYHSLEQRAFFDGLQINKESGPPVIVVRQPENLDDLIFEKLHALEVDCCDNSDYEQRYRCSKFYDELRTDVNERLLSDSDSDSRDDDIKGNVCWRRKRKGTSFFDSDDAEKIQRTKNKIISASCQTRILKIPVSDYRTRTPLSAIES